ncbi:hypothetical protein Ddc_19713 [Ditylenchus destructor]|nr:hypothetical protein Ddc_19713 [Ditylenchus destructor]
MPAHHHVLQRRRLAGAVGTDQAVDLTLEDLDAHVRQRLQTAEALGRAGHFQHGFSHSFLLLRRSGRLGGGLGGFAFGRLRPRLAVLGRRPQTARTHQHDHDHRQRDQQLTQDGGVQTAVGHLLQRPGDVAQDFGERGQQQRTEDHARDMPHAAQHHHRDDHHRLCRLKDSGETKPWNAANSAPATPPNEAPMAKASSLMLRVLMPMALAAISSSRIASQARPMRERRRPQQHAEETGQRGRGQDGQDQRQVQTAWEGGGDVLEVLGQMRTAEQRRHVGADRIEGDIAEVEQAGEADDDVQAQGQQHVEQRDVDDAHRAFAEVLREQRERQQQHAATRKAMSLEDLLCM